jgi:regulatory protein
MPPRPASIKVRALQWLAQREHSREELRGKLLRLLQRRPSPGRAGDDGVEQGTDGLALQSADHLPAGPTADSIAGPFADHAADHSTDPAAEVAALLLWLETHGYLSQQRFVESRVHARQSRFGNLRIRQELQQHGVTLDADTQQALQRSEFERAREVWHKRYGGPADDAAARLRQMRFLAGRGFSIDVVRRVLKAGDLPDADNSDVTPR